MKYKIKHTVELYKNTKLSFPFKITGSFSGKFPLKKSGKLKSILFYFATYQTICEGRLKITFNTGKQRVYYDIDMRDIRDNEPYVFKLNKKCLVDKFLNFEIQLEKDINVPFALWVNEAGPCGIIVGDYTEEIEFSYEHLISIVMPIYKCPLEILKQSINSVLKQKYKNWELCIVEDGSKDNKIKRYLSNLNKKYERVKIYNSEKNNGIAITSNKGIKLASGKYICFLDNDDILDKEALLEIAKIINRKDAPDLIYSDEDKISEGGTNFDAFHKPDWNYTMLLSQNYICHLVAYKKSLLIKVKGFRKGYEGSQDYDLLLRCVKETNKIYHIPKVLYHWRTVRGSTATGMGSKASARVNAERAILDHLKARRKKANVSMGECPGTYRVDLKIPENKNFSVCIIIPFKNKIEYLVNLLHTIERSTYGNFRVLLIDNNSSKSEIRNLRKKTFFNWIVSYNKLFSYSAINNYGAKLAKKFDLLLFLNNDMEVMNPDWLEQMIQHFIHPEVSAVGPLLLYPDYKIQHAGVIIGMGGVAGHSHKYMYWGSPGYFGRPHLIQEVSAITGACLMTRTKDFNRVGGFEEELPKAFNDVDYCLKLREINKKIIYTPYARLLHYESLSRGLDNYKDKEFHTAVDYMQKKWNCKDYNDPYYNPNLSLEREDFSYRIVE